MIRIISIIVFIVLSTASHADDWLFTKPVAISSQEKPGTFYHLESSGRKNIAVNNGTVAVTWEDNHEGNPAVYLAFKHASTSGFNNPIRISSGKEAYEPVIISIDDERFLIAWEQDNHIWARIVTTNGAETAIKLDSKKSAQASLAIDPNGYVHIVWSHYEGRHPRIVYASLNLTGNKIIAGKLIPIEPEPPKDKQTYPGIATNNIGITVAWEDRRHGHTKIYYSHRPYNAIQFSQAKQLNEAKTGTMPFGRGPGVTRVTLASTKGEIVAAAWMDKRNFRSGYDIYASVSNDGGLIFGPNEKTQDIGGNNITQWHPAIDIFDNKLIAVAWDDTRDDTSDIWLSWRTAEGWSDDFMVEPASGDGEQNNPAICFDSKGKLHLAWINKLENRVSQLMYASGTLINSN